MKTFIFIIFIIFWLFAIYKFCNIVEDSFSKKVADEVIRRLDARDSLNNKDDDC